jgi:hypothetical protein
MGRGFLWIVLGIAGIGIGRNEGYDIRLPFSFVFSFFLILEEGS